MSINDWNEIKTVKLGMYNLAYKDRWCKTSHD